MTSEEYRKLYKSRYSSTKNLDRGTVFGTFPNGSLTYDTKRFEREREDGVTIIDMVPECRVFIFGVEVTKDVQSVSVKHSLGGNNCTINLTNPRDRYVVTKQDLIGNWREDKDFLATYDYSHFSRISPNRPDLLAALTKNKKIGKYGHSLADQIGQFGSFFKPGKSPVSRMIFETKFYSGISKRAGDILFDYRDPVMVFMKGRFSPYWYFAFTGVIESWDDANAYATEQTINIKCEDPLYLLKRSRFMHRASLIAAGNYEAATHNIGSSTNTNVFKNRLGESTLDEATRMLFFGPTDRNAGGTAKNCHPVFSEFNRKSIKDSDAVDFDIIREVLEAEYSIGKFKAKFNFKETESDLMLSSGQNPSRWWWATGQKPTGYTIPISKIGAGAAQDGKLNTHPLSPWNALYAQMNEIRLTEFNGTELMARYASSVRYWEVTPQMGTNTVSKDGDEYYSGWADSGKSGDTLAIGVAGIHPAMTYEFINYFNILPGIWEQLGTTKEDRKQVNQVLDNLNVSPHEKVRELVVGNPAENRPSPNTGQGSNINLFRPRLFVVIPQKFADTNRSIMTTVMGQLSLLKADSTTVYDSLKEMCAAIQFSFFSSPMGDIFIEPEMHDFHPTEMLVPKDVKDTGRNDSAKIEERTIIQKRQTIKFRAINTGIEKQDIQDTAYMYNPKANHPFFLMEKDRIRCTQTFKPENIKTHITVIGSPTGRGGLVDGAILPTLEKNAALFGSQDYDVKKNSGFFPGIYVADGFGFNINRMGLTIEPFLNAKINYLTGIYKKLIWDEFLKSEINNTFLTIFQNAATAVKEHANAKFDETYNWNTSLLSKVRSLIANNTFDEVDVISPKKYGMSMTEGEKYVAQYFANNILLYMINAQSFGKNKTGGATAQQKQDAQNSTTYNPFSNIDGSMTVKNWLESNNENQINKITDKVNHTNTKKSKLNNVASIVRADLIKIYEPIALKLDTIKDQLKEIFEIESEKDKKLPKMLNFAELKKLEKQGVYNPRLDASRQFGYNKGPTIVNVMINNGAEAARYAVTMFNKLYGKAHRISMDIIGRPELLLNKPYYCELKDAVGLLEDYTLKFSIGSDFQSSVNLTYIRKNALTYKYSFDKLDEVVGTKNNAFFKSAAINYFKSISNTGGNSFNRILTRTMSANGELIGNTVSKGGTGRTLGSKLFNLEGRGFTGGLYTAHDRIGHMEYDLVGTDSNVSVSAGKKEIQNPMAKKTQGDSNEIDTIMAAVTLTCVNIRNKLDELVKNEMGYDAIIKVTKQKETKIEKLEAEKLGQISTSNDKVKNIVKELADEKIALAGLEKRAEAQLNNHTKLIKEIYGITSNPGAKTYANPDGTINKQEPAGKRTPDEATLKTYLPTDRNCLYFKFYHKLLTLYNIGVSNIELVDDRTVGHTKKGFNNSQTAKFGYKGKIPFYADVSKISTGF